MPTRIYEIFAGAPAAVSVGATLVGTASSGTPGAARTLTHPDASSGLVPIAYPINPDRTSNLDNAVMTTSLNSTVLTLGDRKLVSHPGNLADVICTEQWTAGRPVMSMNAGFFRLLYEYFINPPAFDPITPTYIQWAPSDKTTIVYNVQIVNLSTDSPTGDPVNQFDVNELIAGIGIGGGDAQDGQEAFDVGATGWLDKSIFLRLKMISVVA